jgi:hypothetical protein
MTVAVGGSAVEAHADESDEYPVEPASAGRDVRYAQMAVVIHQAKTGRAALADRCAVCREPGCPVRHHAAQVIAAAGVDPRHYDPPPRRPLAVARAGEPTRRLPAYSAPSQREAQRS